MPELTLKGCTPEPLMNYLKALGILRLVSEDPRNGDPGARCCWRKDVLVLQSRLDQSSLLDFFLNSYQPTPLVGPWGARSGFYAGAPEKTARESVNFLMTSQDPRFKTFRNLVTRIRALLSNMNINEKARDEDKLKLLVACRNNLPDDILSWLDTCYVLLSDDRRFPPLLGTGGNEGSGSYFSGFAQQLVACLIRREYDLALETALFGITHQRVYANQTPGHFSPKAAGGVNATQGFEGSVATNPWDYILALEGTCLMASGAVRRFGQAGPRMASFPFTVNVSGVGTGSLIAADSAKPRQAKRDVAEMWLPIWYRPSSLRELKALLAEGRASVRQRQAVYGVDMVRAVAELGVDRGIASFRRTIFLMRNGQSFLAIPAGSISVRQRESVDLIHQLDSWLDRFRRASLNKNVPARFSTALRSIDKAIFEFCVYGGPTFFQAIVIALGVAERELALQAGKIGNRTISPVGNLSSDWIIAANDNTPEFEIALALSGMYDAESRISSIRANLEPVDTWRTKEGSFTGKWADKGRAVVWSSADLSRNLTAVLHRRLTDGQRNGCTKLPLAAVNFVSLNTVSRFLAAELDEQRIEDLLWGLMLLPQTGGILKGLTGHVDAPPLPRAYALLKLLCLPHTLTVKGQPLTIKAEPSIITMLSAGQIGEACRTAMRRLRASGLSPMPHPHSGGAMRDSDWKELDNLGHNSSRLAGALLLPLSYGSLERLQELVVHEVIKTT
jgi:CRISPR-associated protein Csx17